MRRGVMSKRNSIGSQLPPRHQSGRAFPDLIVGLPEMNEIQIIATRDSWVQELRKALDADRWGQVVEAVEGYEILIQVIGTSMSNLSLNGQEEQFLLDLLRTLKSRIDELQGIDHDFNTGSNSSSAEVISSLTEALSSLFENDSIALVLPDAASKHILESGTRNEDSVDAIESSQNEYEDVETPEDSEDENDFGVSARPGTLLPRHRGLPDGSTRLRIDIEKIGLKDFQKYDQPTLRISVVTKWGEELGSTQETPVAHVRGERHIWFNSTVHIQVSKEEIVGQDAAIVIEFIHWKASKSKMSTRCWTLLERDELEPGPKLLQLYAKPFDFHRENFFIHSVKPLYLHLTLRSALVKSATQQETSIAPGLQTTETGYGVSKETTETLESKDDREGHLKDTKDFVKVNETESFSRRSKFDDELKEIDLE